MTSPLLRVTNKDVRNSPNGKELLSIHTSTSSCSFPHYHLQHLNRLSRGPNERTQRTDRTGRVHGWMDGWVFAFVRSCPQGEEEEEEDELKL